MTDPQYCQTGENYDQDLTEERDGQTAVSYHYGERDMTEDKKTKDKKTEDLIRYQVLYHDSDSWSDLTESQVRDRLSGSYIDLDLIIETLTEGQTVLSPYGAYRLKRESESI